MKRTLRRILPLIAAIVVAIAAASAANTAPRWETVDSIVAELATDRIDVTVSGQYIYVYTPEPVNVKVFTILGQLVTQGQLPAGTSRLRVNTRGIYILKAGSATRRITI